MDAHSRRERGMTLYELVVTLAIAAGVTTGAVGLHDVLAKTRQSAHVNALLTDLNVSRSEAIKRRHRVTICRSRSGSVCDDGAWHDGWVVFVDDDGDHTRDPGETLLRVHGAVPRVTLSFNGAGGARRDDFVTYYPDGFSNKNGTFTFCSDGPDRAVVLYWTGRARVADAARGACP